MSKFKVGEAVKIKDAYKKYLDEVYCAPFYVVLNIDHEPLDDEYYYELCTNEEIFLGCCLFAEDELERYVDEDDE